jgi:hypothetical protein
MAFIDFTGKAVPENAARPSNAEIIRVVADGPCAPLQEDKPIKTVAVSRDTLNESAVIGEPTGVGVITHQTKSVQVPAFGGMNSFGPVVLDKRNNRPHSGSNAAPVVVNGGANGNWL